jgi:hypothetical protein
MIEERKVAKEVEREEEDRVWKEWQKEEELRQVVFRFRAGNL